jgi:hypothetical protein
MANCSYLPVTSLKGATPHLHFAYALRFPLGILLLTYNSGSLGVLKSLYVRRLLPLPFVPVSRANIAFHLSMCTCIMLSQTERIHSALLLDKSLMLLVVSGFNFAMHVFTRNGKFLQLPLLRRLAHTNTLLFSLVEFICNNLNQWFNTHVHCLIYTGIHPMSHVTAALGVYFPTPRNEAACRAWTLPNVITFTRTHTRARHTRTKSREERLSWLSWLSMYTIVIAVLYIHCDLSMFLGYRCYPPYIEQWNIHTCCGRDWVTVTEIRYVYSTINSERQFMWYPGVMLSTMLIHWQMTNYCHIASNYNTYRTIGHVVVRVAMYIGICS